jgi:Zn-dependent M28 family amino/carboxypeptidase
MFRNKLISVTGEIDGAAPNTKDIIVFGQDTLSTFSDADGVKNIYIPADSNLLPFAQRIVNSKESSIVIVDTSHAKSFRRITRVDRDMFGKTPSIIFILASSPLVKFRLQVKQDIQETKLSNIVGVIPGKTKSSEQVLFSGHYDHLGIGKPNAQGDSIFNGANDDAAGVTAVIMLSKYYNKIKNNDRTLIFSAFTAEELGGFGSKYFSQQLDPEKVVAMFNIEMIGTESKWGINSAYITGYEKSGLAKILEKNLEGSKFKFYPDPYIAQDLFYRSDNAVLAALGVPAHTISTSKMDDEPYYHKQDDPQSRCLY